MKATGVTDVEVGLHFKNIFPMFFSYHFFHRPCLISSSIRRLSTPKSYFAGWGGAMVAKDVASVSDLVVFMKKERLKIFFPSTQHVISMKNED